MESGFHDRTLQTRAQLEALRPPSCLNPILQNMLNTPNELLWHPVSVPWKYLGLFMVILHPVKVGALLRRVTQARFRINTTSMRDCQGLLQHLIMSLVHGQPTSPGVLLA